MFISFVMSHTHMFEQGYDEEGQQSQAMRGQQSARGTSNCLCGTVDAQHIHSYIDECISSIWQGWHLGAVHSCKNKIE